MASCPEFDSDIDVDEYDVDKGDLISCPECGTNLEVTSVSPLEFESAPDEDDDDGDLDDEEFEDDDEDGDDEDDEGDQEDWDE
jgi:alpha-aminoadipate/glutamate carrier protein LysW